MAFHYPVRVAPANLPRVQDLTLDLVTWLKSELACLFAALQWWMIQAARSGDGRLPVLLVPGFLVVIFATVGWYLCRRYSSGERRAGARRTSFAELSLEEEELGSRKSSRIRRLVRKARESLAAALLEHPGTHEDEQNGCDRDRLVDKIFASG